MKPIYFYFPLALACCVVITLVQPVFGNDDAANKDVEKLQSQVDTLKQSVAALERRLGREANARPSIALRLRSLELSVEQIEREKAKGDKDGDDAERSIRDLSRRIDGVETKVDRIGRNDLTSLERKVDANQRAIRGLENRVRRLE